MLRLKNNLLLYIFQTALFIGMNVVLKNLVLNFVIPQNLIRENIFINFVEIHNSGAAFSLFTSHTLLLSLVSFLILSGLVMVVVVSNKLLSKPEILALSLLTGGVFSNLWERVTLNYVIDYIQLNFINFPIFNFADTMIVLGTCLYVYTLYREKDHGKQ